MSEKIDSNEVFALVVKLAFVPGARGNGGIVGKFLG
jgi:hypothetical protein